MAAKDDLPLPHLTPNVPPGTRSMIAIVSAQPGKEDEFRSRIVELAREVRKEPGCLSFVPYESLEVEGEQSHAWFGLDDRLRSCRAVRPRRLLSYGSAMTSTVRSSRRTAALHRPIAVGENHVYPDDRDGARTVEVVRPAPRQL
jgi:hypothetical protein